jgi:soluble P-type ATPase
MNPHCINLELRVGETRSFHDLVLDYTGTLSVDGMLLPGVAERLTSLSQMIQITVLTADTFGKVDCQLIGLPLQFRIIQNGLDKANVIKLMDSESVIAIGNGRNDVPMMTQAGLSIAVVGPEGASRELLQISDIVVTDIRHALDLIANPLRLKATLRD